MNLEELRTMCLTLPGTTEEFPFDEVTLTFKVMGKIFAITGIDSEQPSVNLKCDPERAIELRESYEDVIAGYHMNKKHWNTVLLEGNLGDLLIRDLIAHSYELVVGKLSKKLKEELKEISKED